MRITICGSSTFYREMVERQEKLNKMGHNVIVHQVYKDFAEGKLKDLIKRIKREHATVKKQYNFIRWYHKAIMESDAILVLNIDKNNIQNYIGGNTLMEMGFAYVNNKKIFLLNEIPNMPYRDEIEAMQPVILQGDLTKIKLKNDVS